MKIAIGTDHRGKDIKKDIINYLKSKGHEVDDLSKKATSGDDYPIYAFRVANSVVTNKNEIGILLCRTGIGMSIAANKVKGARAAKVDTPMEAILTRNDNGANILTLSTEKDINDLYQIIDAFIDAKTLVDDRHKRRVNLIINYENGEYNEL